MCIRDRCSTVQQDTLLSNKQNKIRFIKYLIEYLRNANITVIQAENDADLLIVKTASQITNKIPVMVADNSDILVLLSALIPEEREMCMLKLGKNGTPPTIYSQNSLNELPFCKKYILFLLSLIHI